MTACCAPGASPFMARSAAPERDADVVATRPELLGHHFAQAGAVEKAVHYLLCAGEQSAAASAMVEAQAHLTRGLALAAEMADLSERTLRQAELTLALGNVQMADVRVRLVRARTAFIEAVRLCRTLGREHEQASKLLARALFGSWSSAVHAGPIPAARAIAEDFFALGRDHAGSGDTGRLGEHLCRDLLLSR